MSRLRQTPTLSGDAAAPVFETKTARLELQPFFGVAKIILKTLDEETLKALSNALGVALPVEPNKAAACGKLYICATAPYEWLLFGDEPLVEQAQARCKAALSASSGMALMLSDGRTSFVLSGASAPYVLSSLAPIDFDTRTFAPGDCVNTLFGECGAFIHKIDDTPRFRIITDQTYGPYARRLLVRAIESLELASRPGFRPSR